ncbi:DNA-binding protein [Streptomyces sviceus ATCC 29083]|uniref:DNA-binding protein n=1 Tax=Streptomyces sviceus (strain ATCC 29083 / DSM 924 / JCM 4929 / NBRC 13980 / NCIMB 11184 / NRRL 5439 / UC 5370) TaxID=463191 RepID=B5HUG7_STRX2|nr:DNA-binding protein [Streptomyces sviceus ATCC 29083]
MAGSACHGVRRSGRLLDGVVPSRPHRSAGPGVAGRGLAVGAARPRRRGRRPRRGRFPARGHRGRRTARGEPGRRDGTAVPAHGHAAAPGAAPGPRRHPRVRRGAGHRAARGADPPRDVAAPRRPRPEGHRDTGVQRRLLPFPLRPCRTGEFARLPRFGGLLHGPGPRRRPHRGGQCVDRRAVLGGHGGDRWPHLAGRQRPRPADAGGGPGGLVGGDADGCGAVRRAHDRGRQERMSGGTQVSYEELLTAGAVLPPDIEEAGERAVPLTARSYRHPGLDDRVVVRLVAGELGAAEDLAAGFLGLEPAAEPAVVGLGLRQSLGFPEWVLVHHPEDGHHALGVVPDLERAARQAKSRPKAALDAYLELGGRLAASVPHFLPTFYEQAGRVFLAEENATYAAQLFTRARKAEAEHGLAVEEDRLDAVFLEFALAGALPVKVLSAYGKDLAGRVSAEEALERFTRLCLRRTAGGLPPSAQMANDLRKLARGAGRDADRAEQDYLAELLALPATLRATGGWWKGHRAALVALAEREPRVRGTLLDMLPAGPDADMPAMWLEVLETSGATTGLWDDSLPAQQRPSDGTVGWLERFLAFRERARSWRSSTRLPELYPLVERVAALLRAELTASGRGLRVTHDIDLIDLLLSLDVPVAAPGKNQELPLTAWAIGEGQRELSFLGADARFRDAFLDGADRFHQGDQALRALRLLAASPGGRPWLTEWVSRVVRQFTVVGLPGLPHALNRLGWLPAEALALAEDDVRAAVGTDLAPVLARTLQAGLFDELSWPAWEEATAELVAKDRVEDIVVADAWPHLVVAGTTQARVIGADGTLLTHDLRLPANDVSGDPGFHHVDGELLVYWNSRRDGLRGYWHSRADRVESLKGAHATRGTEMDWYRGDFPITLPLPDGGRTTGRGVVHAGDTTLPDERPLLFDGSSYWVWHADSEDRAAHGWYEYDPATNERGRMSKPAFLADALRDAPAGSSYVGGRLRLSPTTDTTPTCAPVDGLVGLRMIELPDGSHRAEDLAGRCLTLPAEAGVPDALVVFPGADRATAVVRDNWQLRLVDADGVHTAWAKTDRTPGDFGEGTLLLPPVQFWECLTARDPQASKALRTVDRDTAAALLTAAADEDAQALTDAIRTLLPVSHDALVKGIAGVARYAAAQQAVLDAAATRLTRALEGGLEEEGPAGPADTKLMAAMNGLGSSRSYWWNRDDESDTVFRALRVLARAVGVADTALPDLADVRLHLDGHPLPSGQPDLATLLERTTALAFRAACATTAQEDREVLCTLLAEFDRLGLTPDDSTAWRKVHLHLEAAQLRTATGGWRDGAWNGVLPLADSAFIAVTSRNSLDDDGACFTGYFHDPAGRFESPLPYQVLRSGPLGENPVPGRIRTFLAELAERGPAPWFPEAAEEFARLTGVTETVARLVVAGLPGIDVYERNFLTPFVTHPHRGEGGPGGGRQGRTARRRQRGAGRRRGRPAARRARPPVDRGPGRGKRRRGVERQGGQAGGCPGGIAR